MTQPSASLHNDRLKIYAIAAFNDNYIWLIEDCDSHQLWVVDPGDGNAVLAFLAQHSSRNLCGVLITHHHNDHIGGINALTKQYPAVAIYGVKSTRVDAINHTVTDGQTLTLSGNLILQVLSVPGHTSDHIAFYAELPDTPVLFCGDTLFSSGCGRLFEGTPSTMRASLAKIRQLPASTLVFCAHEYTSANINFALAVEPNNAAIKDKQSQVLALRANGQATVPTTLAIELKTNPFLRWDQPEVIKAAQEKGANPADFDSVFASIRQWKDTF